MWLGEVRLRKRTTNDTEEWAGKEEPKHKKQIEIVSPATNINKNSPSGVPHLTS